MQNWLWADPDHVFWMRLVLALAPGVWVPLAGFAGFLLFRWRERARLQEQTMAELRKVRLEAIADVLKAWTAHFAASYEARHLRGILNIAQDPQDQAKLKAMIAGVEAREKKSLTEFTDLVMARAMLLPKSVTAAYMRYMKAPAHTRQRERALNEVEAAFQALLPKLPERWRPIWKLRYRIATWAGADKDELPPSVPTERKGP